MYPSVQSRARRFAFSVCFIIVSTFCTFGQPSFDKAEFAARRVKLMEKIGNNIAIVFGSESHIYPVEFRQSPDFYYLTGIEEPGSVLVINGSKKRSWVFAPKRTASKIAGEGPGVRDTEKPFEVYGIPILPLENFYTISGFTLSGAEKMFLQFTPPDDLEVARDEVISHNAERKENTVFRSDPPMDKVIEEMKKWKPNLQTADLSPLIDELRWVKSPYEIERMRKAGQIVAEATREAIKGTKAGMFEYEIEAAARFINVKRGARGDGFTPIVASGPNTVIYHYTANNRQMQAGEFVYIDYGADYDYYVSDITRVWPVSGRFTAEQEKWYRCILEARNTIISMMKPGITVEDMQKAAEPVYQKHGYLDNYKKGGRYVGHFVGISVHDPGDETKPFVPGVVFNVEPVIEFPERKLHMRLEDTILITEKGSENLTAGAPVELEEIYTLINQQPIGSKKTLR